MRCFPLFAAHPLVAKSAESVAFAHIIPIVAEPTVTEDNYQHGEMVEYHEEDANSAQKIKLPNALKFLMKISPLELKGDFSVAIWQLCVHTASISRSGLSVKQLKLNPILQNGMSVFGTEKTHILQKQACAVAARICKSFMSRSKNVLRNGFMIET